MGDYYIFNSFKLGVDSLSKIRMHDGSKTFLRIHKPRKIHHSNSLTPNPNIHHIRNSSLRLTPILPNSRTLQKLRHLLSSIYNTTKLILLSNKRILSN